MAPSPASTDGIDVTARNVTIDLNGFSITGPGSSGTLTGINAGGQSVVRGGTETRDSRLADWLKGRLLPRCNPPDLGTAENCLRRVTERLRATGDRFMELRCATDLARVLRDGGRRDEGRALLAGIHNWFTEGLDTRHLKDAKSLLDELGE
jgi:hypothetical protein